MVPFNPKNVNLYGRKLMDILFTKQEMQTCAFEARENDKRSKKRPLSSTRTKLIKGMIFNFQIFAKIFFA
jgi:hypothetical protein